MSAATPTRAPLPFTDGRGCKEWLNVLPLTNIPQAQQTVLETLQSHAGSRPESPSSASSASRCCATRSRSSRASSARATSARRIPLSPNDSSAWNTGRALLEEMEARLSPVPRRCRRPIPAGWASMRALIAQRVMRYIGAQMLFHAIVFRRFDPALWQRLHQLYLRIARPRGTASEARQGFPRGRRGRDERGANLRAGRAHPGRVPLGDERAAGGFRRGAAAPVGAQGAGARAVAGRQHRTRRRARGRPRPSPSARGRSRAPASHATQRMLDTDALSKSIRRRIHGLQNGEDLATLGLPAQASSLDVPGELAAPAQALVRGRAAAPAAKAASQPNVGLVFGMPEIYFFVSGGKAFEQPDKKREMTSQEKQDIEVFGRVREQTQSKMVAEFNYTVENWAAVDESLGTRARAAAHRPRRAAWASAASRRLRMGDTGAFLPRDGERAHAGDRRARSSPRSRSSRAGPSPSRCAPETCAIAPRRSGCRASACPRSRKRRSPRRSSCRARWARAAAASRSGSRRREGAHRRGAAASRHRLRPRDRLLAGFLQHVDRSPRHSCRSARAISTMHVGLVTFTSVR